MQVDSETSEGQTRSTATPRWDIVRAVVARLHDAAVAHPSRTLAISLTCALVFSATLVSCQRVLMASAAPVTAVPSVEPEIRVRIRDGVTSASIAADRAVLVRPPLRESERRAGTTVIRGAMTVTRSSRDWVLTPSDGSAPLRFPADANDRMPLELAASSGTLEVDGARYPGFVRLYPRRSAGAGAFDVVAELELEPYVAGVIARELYGSWDLETFAAQAVAARSYGLHERARSRAEDRYFDVESTTRDQVFGGSAEIDVAVRAASITRGYVLRYGGELLRAYYSSTCGGRAGSARDTWPSGPDFDFNNAPPIQAHIRTCDCSASALYRWTRERSVSELSARFGAWAKDHDPEAAKLRNVAQIDVAVHNAAGRPSVYRVTDNRGRRVEVRAESLRIALNHRAPGQPRIGRSTRVPSGDFEITRAGSRFTLRGRGFGHGVGMCQFGAQDLATKGYGWRRILAHYYPGAAPEKLYP